MNEVSAMTHKPRTSRSALAPTLAMVVFLSLFVICHSSFAEPLTIDLVSEVASIQPGTPFYVGLRLKHQEHYHTYWKFPGIVGVPTSMEWKLPAGWRAGPIEWPAPERVMMFQIRAQGYHDEVLLPMKITPPNDLQAGAKITLKGKAVWMCCGIDCNPGFADLSVTLPADKLPAPLDMRWKDLFVKARADMPQPLAGFDTTATRDGGSVILRLTPEPDKKGAPDPLKESPPSTNSSARPRRANYLQRLFPSESGKRAGVGPAEIKAPAGSKSPGIFFTEDGYINADKDQVFRREGDTLVIELTISTYFTDAVPDELRGILWLRDGSLGRGAIIRVPFAK